MNHGMQIAPFRSKLRIRPFMLRRGKEDVATELPAETTSIHSVDTEAMLRRSLKESSPWLFQAYRARIQLRS